MIEDRLFIKKVSDDYILHRIKDNVLTIEGDSEHIIFGIEPFYKLSKKNCDAIANGYDLDEMATEYAEQRTNIDIPYSNGLYYGFVEGFKKRNEMLKNIPNKPDPKLIDSMCLRYRHDFGMIKDEAEKNSLRVTMTQLWEEVVGVGFYAGKTEWDVEIEMEKVSDGLDEMAQNQYSKQPKLDADGCIILKLKLAIFATRSCI
jgi:hypothetical protein